MLIRSRPPSRRAHQQRGPHRHGAAATLRAAGWRPRLTHDPGRRV